MESEYSKKDVMKAWSIALRRPKEWTYTNPKTKETYRFRRLKNGTIKTVAFLGWKAPNGRLIKKR